MFTECCFLLGSDMQESQTRIVQIQLTSADRHSTSGRESSEGLSAGSTRMLTTVNYGSEKEKDKMRILFFHRLCARHLSRVKGSVFASLQATADKSARQGRDRGRRIRYHLTLKVNSQASKLVVNLVMRSRIADLTVHLKSRNGGDWGAHDATSRAASFSE